VTRQVLVVDDENTLRHFLGLNLKNQGYQVGEAADGKTAMRLIDQQHFDVALVDLRLTDMDGLDIVRYLRQVAPQTGVIILTAYATFDSAIEALRQGAHDYLTKPFKPRNCSPASPTALLASRRNRSPFSLRTMSKS